MTNPTPTSAEPTRKKLKLGRILHYVYGAFIVFAILGYLVMPKEERRAKERAATKVQDSIESAAKQSSFVIRHMLTMWRSPT